MLVTLFRSRFNGRICSTPLALKMPLPVVCVRRMPLLLPHAPPPPPALQLLCRATPPPPLLPLPLFLPLAPTCAAALPPNIGEHNELVCRVSANTVSHLRRPRYCTIECDFSWYKLAALPSRRMIFHNFCCTTFSDDVLPCIAPFTATLSPAQSLFRCSCAAANCCLY